jgi:hypothetical protein
MHDNARYIKFVYHMIRLPEQVEDRSTAKQYLQARTESYQGMCYPRKA